MNRIMVLLLGSTLLLLGILAPMGDASAEMPRLTSSSARPLAPRVTWHRDLNSGWAEAIRRKVPMVIYITTERCRYCDAMKRDTWCNELVQSDLAGDFVAIELSPQANASTLGRIDVKTYPTTLIGVPEGKIVEHRTGYQPAAEMRSLLRGVKNRMLARRDQ